MNKLSGFMILCCVALSAWCGEQSEGLVADPYRATDVGWPKYVVGGRDYRYLLDNGFLSIPEVENEPFVKAAGVSKVRIREMRSGGARTITIPGISLYGESGEIVAAKAAVSTADKNAIVEDPDALFDGNGNLLGTSEALVTGAVYTNHVKVVYADGTALAVNGSFTAPFVLDWFGEKVSLSPNGYIGRSGKDVKVFSGEVGGHRADLSVSEDYVYVDGCGKAVSFPEGGATHVLLRLADTSDPNREEVFLLEGSKEAELPYAVKSVTALDEAGAEKPDVNVPFEIVSGRTRLKAVEGAVSYRTIRF